LPDPWYRGLRLAKASTTGEVVASTVRDPAPEAQDRARRKRRALAEQLAEGGLEVAA
jgi:hypothetical protein